MLDYQFGKHLKFEDVLKHKERYARLFSEGNLELKKLLLNLWDKEIETYMCCTGHDYGDAAYIMMYLPLDNKEMIFRIVNSVYNLNGVTTRLGREHDKERILVDIKSYNNDSFFRYINRNLDTNISEDHVASELSNIVEILSNFNHEKYDLYCEISNYGVGKNFYAYVNSITNDLDSPVRHMYVLNKYLKKHELLEQNNFFSDEELEQKSSEYERIKKLSR